MWSGSDAGCRKPAAWRYIEIHFVEQRLTLVMCSRLRNRPDDQLSSLNGFIRIKLTNDELTTNTLFSQDTIVLFNFLSFNMSSFNTYCT
jgi:hypothetical protein